MPAIGAHIDGGDPLDEARARDADLVQLFLGDPQAWTDPPPGPAAGELAAAGIPVYVHAPYVLNVATTNNRIRVPSRTLLVKHAEAAARAGAAGLVVHGGHVTAGVDPAEGVANWRKTVERVRFPLPVLIENTAGGERAMARHLDALGRLWDGLSTALDDGADIGFCLDTCHAHAAGEDLLDVVARVRAITGRIDLVHCNDSRDEFGSGRDRHANVGSGRIDPELLLAVVRAADAPVVVETPGGAAGQAADIAALRERL